MDVRAHGTVPTSSQARGRFLEDNPQLLINFFLQETVQIEVYADTDWAGCVQTTSGGCMFRGDYRIKSEPYRRTTRRS